jgi:predicted metal-dependent phosphoesterase TrpH
MLFEIHCHTNHSRGTKIPTEATMAPRDAVRIAKRAGIDGLAITDHRVTTAWKESREEAKKQGMIFIPGQEIDSTDGHIIGLGLSDAVENGLCAEETLDRIREQGAFSVAPHPWDIKNDGLKDGSFKADAVEVFNSFVLDRVSNWYAKRRAEKAGRPMVVGSDAHMPDMMGLSVNVADANSMEEFFREVKKGRVGFRTSYVPVDSVVSWARTRLYSSYDDVLRYINRNYSQPKAWVSKSLMGVFVGSKTRAWNIVGGLAIGCSVIYSSAKLLTY